MPKFKWSFKEGMIEGEIEADGLTDAVSKVTQILLHELDVIPFNPTMKYLVTVEALTYQDYIVEAESVEEAKERALSGEVESYGNANSGYSPQITNVEVYDDPNNHRS